MTDAGQDQVDIDQEREEQLETAILNKGPEAPISSVADYGLESNLFQAMPKMAAAV